MGLDIVFHMGNLDFGDATVANGESHWPTKNGESLDFKGGNTLSSGSDSTLLFSQTVANHFSANIRDGKLDVESHTETKGSFDPSRIRELLPTMSYHKFLPFSIHSMSPEDCATISASLLPHPTPLANLKSTEVPHLEMELADMELADDESSAPTSYLEVKKASDTADLAIEINLQTQSNLTGKTVEDALPLQLVTQETSSIQEEVLSPDSQDTPSVQEELEDVYEEGTVSNINIESTYTDPILSEYMRDIDEMLAQ